MSKTLLVIKVSPNGPNSISNSLVETFVGAWKEKNADGKVIERDLQAEPVPFLDAEAIYANYTPEDARSESQKSKFDARMALINELKGATDIVVGTPMWNWGPPAVFKAWVDALIMPGVFDPQSDPKPMVGSKWTFCVSQGGTYSVESGKGGMDYLTGYLVQVPKVLGAEDIDLFVAEFGLAGIAPGMEGLVEAKEKSIADAKAKAIARGSA